MTISIEINPYLALAVIIGLIIVYAIKRCYDQNKAELNAKAQQGQHIY